MYSLLTIAVLVAAASAGQIRFKKEKCIEGHGDFHFRVAYFDSIGTSRHAEYSVPGSAVFSAACVDKTLSQKKANLTLQWDKDVLTLQFTAPAVIGKTVSLRGANYRYYTDRHRFPRSPEESYKAVHREWAEDAQKIGEWNKKYTCSSLTLPLGSGVQLELRNLLFEVFKVADNLSEVKCPVTAG